MRGSSIIQKRCNSLCRTSKRRFESFGWRSYDVDGKGYHGIVGALRCFKYEPRDGRPTAIISNTRKGWGGFSSFLSGHKVELPDELVAQELELQNERRKERVQQLLAFLSRLEGEEEGDRKRQLLLKAAEQMNLSINVDEARVLSKAVQQLT